MQLPQQAHARRRSLHLTAPRQETAAGGARLQCEHVAAYAGLEHIGETRQPGRPVAELQGRVFLGPVDGAQLADDALVDRVDGTDQVEKVDLRGRNVVEPVEPINGQSMKLTLDLPLQQWRDARCRDSR